MLHRAYPIGLTLAVLCLSPATAQDRALLIGNENYSDGADITAADDLLSAEDPLAEAGFAVTVGSDLDTQAIRDLLSAFLAEPVQDGRLVIALSGHFAQSPHETWFLGTEASSPDLAGMGAVGLSLASVLEVAAQQPGGAVVLLGTEPRRLPLGTGLEPGIGQLDIPQGVTLVRGDAARIADFAARALVVRGQSLTALLDAAPDLTGDGFLAPVVPFRPAGEAGTADPVPGPDAETVFWESTTLQGTEAAFDAYLKRYPQGRYVAEAQAEIQRIRAEPSRAARAEEEALALSRDDRQAVQRNLSILGFDPKGIDGIFGAGSRSAISEWQRRNGQDPTGYLTRAQVADLTTQAEARAAELEAEAAERKAAQAQEDRQYWEDTGAAGDAAGLRAYLRRFPDGLYAEVATERLAALEAETRGEAEDADRVAWDLARRENTVASYRQYLDGYPNGAFAEQANVRIDALEAEADQGDLSRYEAAETALGLDAGARRIVEQRLAALDLRPGEVDGVFDDRTRRAIRRFQETRNIPQTGYLDQSTTVALLAGGLLRPAD